MSSMFAAQGYHHFSQLNRAASVLATRVVGRFLTNPVGRSSRDILRFEIWLNYLSFGNAAGEIVYAHGRGDGRERSTRALEREGFKSLPLPRQRSKGLTSFTKGGNTARVRVISERLPTF